jgi:hypothetical protein
MFSSSVKITSRCRTRSENSQAHQPIATVPLFLRMSIVAVSCSSDRGILHRRPCSPLLLLSRPCVYPLFGPQGILISTYLPFPSIIHASRMDLRCLSPASSLNIVFPTTRFSTLPSHPVVLGKRPIPSDIPLYIHFTPAVYFSQRTVSFRGAATLSGGRNPVSPPSGNLDILSLRNSCQESSASNHYLLEFHPPVDRNDRERTEYAVAVSARGSWNSLSLSTKRTRLPGKLGSRERRTEAKSGSTQRRRSESELLGAAASLSSA